MDRITDIEKIISQYPEQQLQWNLLIAYVAEYLTNGFNAQLVLDIQKGRISNIKRSDWSSGLTQSTYYLEKIDND